MVRRKKGGRLKAILLLLLPLAASAATVDPHRLADAIYIAEGGARARRPYGIVSVRVSGHAEARAVCLRTIRTALSEWDGRGDPIAAVGRRYCPPESDPVGHGNWVRNVNRLYRTR